ncbi:M23 family metallopeptidase [Arthrobacter sp. M4]|uniref:M23 family metallopeptidase n=1 Tax=Arthrobacter sp. M4 TaxID=218160 RepID=UPI001CDBB184|nr:M23 family metallopeptidase [Arthrobacter sp. M4]MCA4133717.1 M23 family metallopeptidase [Arthrobacter sp. M4]
MKIPSLSAAGLLLAGALSFSFSSPVPDTKGSSEADHTQSKPQSEYGWSWPLSPKPKVLQHFDPPPKPWLSGHRGVDLMASGDGTEVLAPESGTVSFEGVVVDRPVITVDHGSGLRSSFEPVATTLEAGARVEKGQVIGTVQGGHCPTDVCLHWGVRRGVQYVNPLSFVLDMRPSVLLPLEPTRWQTRP